MSPTDVRTLLNNHVPLPALDYAYQLWNESPFLLKVTRARASKVGDFTGCRNNKRHRITLNRDLNPYLFLITYVHEVAHLRVYLHYGNRVDPHGAEWKNVFRHLLAPLMSEDVFPPDILRRLTIHMNNPRASSFSDRDLTVALRAYDDGAAMHTMVGDLPEGSVFKLQGKYFRKGKLRRTRVLCREVRSKRQYLVPAEALVTDVQLSLLG